PLTATNRPRQEALKDWCRDVSEAARPTRGRPGASHISRCAAGVPPWVTPFARTLKRCVPSRSCAGSPAPACVSRMFTTSPLPRKRPTTRSGKRCVLKHAIGRSFRPIEFLTKAFVPETEPCHERHPCPAHSDSGFRLPVHPADCPPCA